MFDKCSMMVNTEVGSGCSEASLFSDVICKYTEACALSEFKIKMLIAIHDIEVQLGEGSAQFQGFMSKVTQRVHNMETNTLIVACIEIY